MPSNNCKSKSLPWDVVEIAIEKEIRWLKDIIATPFYKSRNKRDPYEVCKDCIYRRIAILIVSGKIRARDIKSTVCLWGKVKSFPTGKSHGKDWHVGMMNLISSYFQSLGFDVAIEPSLNKGRADLGVYGEGRRSLFVEIGTVSLHKLLFNLESMEDSDFLIVTDTNRAVEFSVLKAGYKDYSI